MRIVFSCIVVGLLAIVPGLAAGQTWTGQIGDSMCGLKHMPGEHGRKTMSDRACAQTCAQKGGQYVLVADGKTYKLTNRDADLKAHAGHAVDLTGNLTGDTIRVEKIEISKAAK
jgi:hypothetical protein